MEAGDHDPSRRKYKHVYYHSSSTTWQVVRRGFPKVMCHTDQDTVAKRAAKAWKVSVQSLRLAVGKPKHGNRTLPVRKYKHVTWHAQGKTWRVYDRKTYIGSSTILSTAVQMACKHFRVSKAELELGRPRPPNNNKTNLCKRFAILLRIYKGTCEEDPLVPCDLEDLLRRVSTSRVMQDDHASGLIFPLLASKFPEHRDAVEDAFTFDPQKSEVDNVYESLVKAAHNISAKPCRMGITCESTWGVPTFRGGGTRGTTVPVTPAPTDLSVSVQVKTNTTKAHTHTDSRIRWGCGCGVMLGPTRLLRWPEA